MKRWQILIAEFVVDFSYHLGIGEQFETWQDEEANWRKGLKSKVFLFERISERISKLISISSQARQMLRMWRSDKGREATTQLMLSVLRGAQESGTPVQDIIDDIESSH